MDHPHYLYALQLLASDRLTNGPIHLCDAGQRRLTAAPLIMTPAALEGLTLLLDKHLNTVPLWEY